MNRQGDVMNMEYQDEDHILTLSNDENSTIFDECQKSILKHLGEREAMLSGNISEAELNELDAEEPSNFENYNHQLTKNYDDELMTQNSQNTRTTAYTNSAKRNKTLDNQDLVYTEKSKSKNRGSKNSTRNARSGKKNITEYEETEVRSSHRNIDFSEGVKELTAEEKIKKAELKRIKRK